jgi:hypothetical protein
MVDFKIIQIKTNAQNLYGWLALSNTDQPVGHIFMQVYGIKDGNMYKKILRVIQHMLGVYL